MDAPAGLAHPAIEARGLSRKFGTLTALDAVDVEVAQGESVAVFGPNGAGKTTLVRILTSTLRPTSGTVRIGGLDPRSGDSRVNALVGVISHQSFLYDELSALDNLAFFARLHGVAAPRRRSLELLDSLDLGDRAHDPVRGYSRGMQQRLSLARCLVHDPRIVFLDEPFTGLDTHSATTLRQTLERLRAERRTILLITHNLARGLELCDRWILLDRGRVAAKGRSSEVDRNALEKIYLERVGVRRRGVPAGP